MSLKTRARELLLADPTYLDDARMFAPRGNSLVGSILNLTHGTPRQYAEQAVAEAVSEIDGEEAS